jgi:putative RecB family exonuclease
VARSYSHSRFSSFENCPKQFHYRYVLRIPAESESIEAFLGKRVHEILERLLQVVQTGRIPSLPAVLKRFHQEWERKFSPERIRIVRSEESVSFYRELGERCLRNHYRRHYPFDGDETLGLEEAISFSLDEEGSVAVRGVIDRLVRARDGAIEIHDYKTGRRIPPQRALDQDRQLALYQLGLDGRYRDVPQVRLVWHYLLFDQVRTSTRTTDQLAELRKRSLELVARIESERAFEPTPSPLCAWCEYRDRCPASGAGPRPRERVEPQAAAASERIQATSAGVATEAQNPGDSVEASEAQPTQLSLL